MRAHSFLGAAIVLGAWGCSTAPERPHYAIESRVVIARSLAPNLMLLVDRSSSMLTNASTVAPCPSSLGACGPGAPCPAGCPTRLSELQSALGELFAARGTEARFGVSMFPKDAACAPAGEGEVLLHLPAAARVDDAGALRAHAALASATVGTLQAAGDHSTADSLRFVGSLAELTDPDRADFVLLISDGLPACKTDSPGDDAVAAIGELRRKDIRTIVVGFGADALSPAAFDTLNRMARAGGFSRGCPMGTDAECGPADSCDLPSRLCRRGYFAAADGPALSALLTSDIVTELMQPPRTCDLALDRLDDPATLSVVFNGVHTPGCQDPVGCDTWTYADGAVHFHGAACQQLATSTHYSPVRLTVQFARSP